MSGLQYAESVVVACSPEALYDMVSDVTRMGEWSPVCRTCWWDDGDGPRPGAWFTGRNELPDRFGDDAEAQIANRTEAARRGIPVTLAALKKAAEAG